MNTKIKLLILVIIIPLLFSKWNSTVSAKDVPNTKVPVVRLHDGALFIRPIDTVVNDPADWAFQTKSVSIDVINTDNSPIQNATAVVTLINYSFPYPTTFNNITMTTDNTGNILLQNLLLGSYHLSVSAPGYVSKELNIDTSLSAVNVVLNSAYTFDDEFNGTQLDTTKWDSTNYNGSIITENSGNLTLGALKQQYTYFPLVQNHDPIPTTQNYTFTVKYKFDNSTITDINRKTGGIMIGLSGVKYDSNIIFGNSPFINNTNMWLYSDLNTNLNGIGTGHSYQTALSYTYLPFDNNWHILTVIRTGGTFGGTTTILSDNNLVITDSINIDPPKYIFLGIPGSQNYNSTFQQYPNLIIDYVNIKSSLW